MLLTLQPHGHTVDWISVVNVNQLVISCYFNIVAINRSLFTRDDKFQELIDLIKWHKLLWNGLSDEQL